jgi:hypothetical protein
MGHEVQCERCGQHYYSVSDHECPGTPTERIEQLEQQVVTLTKIVEMLAVNSGTTVEEIKQRIEAMEAERA